MPFQFKRIALIGTHRQPKVAETVQDVAQLLQGWALDFVLETETAAGLASANEFSILPLEQLGQDCDVAIVVGGDGNLLAAGRELSKHGVPVIGINRGKLGYLTDINPHELETSLRPLLEGQYQIEKRFLLAGQVLRNGQSIGEGTALNDIVLFPGETAQMMEFELQINDQFVYSQRSDGLIVSTPTGSTAYSLSAGGPIVQPDMNAVILVPMFPHTLTSRPIVVDADSTFKIHLAKDTDSNPRISFDGQKHIDLLPDDQICIQKQAQPLNLIHSLDYDYYHVLRSKLHWGQPLVPLGR